MFSLVKKLVSSRTQVFRPQQAIKRTPALIGKKAPELDQLFERLAAVPTIRKTRTLS